MHTSGTCSSWCSSHRDVRDVPQQLQAQGIGPHIINTVLIYRTLETWFNKQHHFQEHQITITTFFNCSLVADDVNTDVHSATDHPLC